MPAMTTPITHTRAGYCYPSDISFYLNYLIQDRLQTDLLILHFQFGGTRPLLVLASF